MKVSATYISNAAGSLLADFAAVPFFNSRNSEYQAAIGRYLHLPGSEVRRLLHRNRKFLRGVECFRNTPQSINRLEKHVESFTVDSKEETTKFLAEDKRSRLLVSFHFGDFIYGNNVLASYEGYGRKQFFFTQLNPTTAFTANMEKAFGISKSAGPRQLTSKSSTAIGLVKKLKAENTSLLTFMDLPRGFGECTRVNFLGRHAWFPKGPAMLSLLAGVPILPILNYQEGNRHIINVFPLIESGIGDKNERKETAQRITQQLVSYLERALALYPSQWRFLSALPSFFVPDTEG